MSWLLDVNMILASRWTTHPDHLRSKSWVDSVAQFHTCAITELGFIRISLSSAYQATWDEAQQALAKLHDRPGYRFLPDDTDGAAAPQTDSRDTTDAHLVTLAKRHALKLATLDATLIAKPWAAGLAENPLSANPTIN
ncbi:MAG: PIN domain-containing protein [Chthoniobacterales bacterium]